MKAILSFLVFFVCFKSFGQTYTHFKWDIDEVVFKTVKMTAYYSGANKSQETIFTGYKDASITIKQGTQSSQSDATISAKLSGYFDIEDAIVSEFSYKIKDFETSITYSATAGTDLFYITIYVDEVTGKISRIFAAATKNFIEKKSKTLFFNLSGFE
jgi:hypothetical protein